MTHILLYWNHICVLHRQEKAFLQELAGRLHREDIELEVRFFGLGYPEHMSEYLARPDAVLVNPLFYQSPRGGPYCGRCCGRSGWFYTISPARTATLGDCAGWSGGSWSGAGTSPTTCPPCGSLWTV